MKSLKVLKYKVFSKSLSSQDWRAMEEEALCLSQWNVSSEEEAEDFAADVLPTSFFVVHDASRCGHHDEAELSGGKEIRRPLFDLIDGDVESRRDDSAFVQSSRQIHHDLAGSVVVDALELSDVSVLHHHRQELDDDFRVGSDENLSLASLLRVIDRLQGISQNVHANHLECLFLKGLT